jgi:hypothetical protein
MMTGMGVIMPYYAWAIQLSYLFDTLKNNLG